MPGAGGRPAARLGEHRGVSVVVHHHRQPQPLAHQVPEGHAVERGQMVRPARHARLPLHQRRHAEADHLDIRGGRSNLLHGVGEDVEGLLPLGSAPGPVNPVVDHHLLVDDPAEKLGASGVDPDHAPRRHGQ
jgi:hypothetical protein